ncbi:MAG: TIGR04282 family arsenosugar biosynthesis glycosyltransferase [Burkholderiales bacterium]
MADKSDVIVQVFARAPEPGQVKTRLIPMLGDNGAATLYRSLAAGMLKMANEAAVGPLELWCTPNVDHEFFSYCSTRFNASLHRQHDGDLGLRMHTAIEEGLTRAHHVLLVGTDCASLTTTDLRAAASALIKGYDAAFGPAEDGGYVLVGLSTAMPSLFDSMHWGTDRVMDETRERLLQLGWRWHEITTQWDVDRPEDYQRLIRTDTFAATHAVNDS